MNVLDFQRLCGRVPDDFIYRKAFAECVERIFYQIHTVGVIDYVFIDCIGDCKRGFIVASLADCTNRS